MMYTIDIDQALEAIKEICEIVSKEERKQLIAEDYQPWSRYQSRNPEHYGK